MLKAKKGLDVGFEARVMRPYAGSNYDSDESIGLVGRKTLFNGGLLESQIKEAQRYRKQDFLNSKLLTVGELRILRPQYRI